MKRLVETSRGVVLIERNGPFGSLSSFGDEGWESTDAIFEGEGGLAQCLRQLGFENDEAVRVAGEYWTTWDSRFAPGYYAEARRLVRWIVACGALMAILIALALWLILR